MNLELKTASGAKPTTRADLVWLVREVGVPTTSRIVSVDGGRSWVTIADVLKTEVDSVDERTLNCLRLRGMFGESLPNLMPDQIALRRRLRFAFGVAFFACFTPWFWLRANDGETSISAMPFGVSLWWGSICAFLVFMAAAAAAVDLALPKVAVVRSTARWMYMVGAIAAVCIPILGYVMAWACAGLIEPLQFLFDIRHDLVSVLVIPVGILVEVAVGAVALTTSRSVWAERVGSLSSAGSSPLPPPPPPRA